MRSHRRHDSTRQLSRVVLYWLLSLRYLCVHCWNRVISRAPGLKLVVQTLLSSLRPIGNIVLICCTFFIIFGILGLQVPVTIMFSSDQELLPVSTHCCSSCWWETLFKKPKASSFQIGSGWNLTRVNARRLTESDFWDDVMISRYRHIMDG